MNNHITAVMAALMLTGAAAAAQTAPKTIADPSALDACEKIALARVQGEVLERRPLKYPTGINYEYLIKTIDGRQVVVTVDGKTRKVFAIMEEAGATQSEEPSPE